MPFKKGQSGNPKGKPKGAISACTKAKADYFKVYQKLGGYKAFLKYMQQNEGLWPDFYFKVLPGLMPKKTDLDMKGTAVIILDRTYIEKPPNSGMEEERKE